MNLIKLASPFVPLANKTGLSASGTFSMTLNRAPSKNPAQFNINVKNLLLAGSFTNDWLTKILLRGTLIVGLLYNPLRRYTVGQFIQKYPPTPSGVPYRLVNPVSNVQEGQYLQLANVNAYTDLLNRSKSFPEKLSSMDDIAAYWFALDTTPNTPVYLVDSKDAVNWLYDRRGLLFTNELWSRAAKARQNVTSQLYKLPQSIYYAWSNNDDTSAYSMRFNEDRDKNNLYVNVFNPKTCYDEYYGYYPYSGYRIYKQDGKALTPGLHFLDFLETQDHELSHSFNDIGPSKLEEEDDTQWIWDGWNSGYKDNIFFRKTNNPELPYYDDDTTSKRVKNYSDLFSGTYLERPSEYIGAMARVKRYGAELGYDTNSQDPVKAREAMSKTLQYFTTHPEPETLTNELQRIHGWLNEAARNSMKAKQKDKQNTWDYTEDSECPLYTEVLDFMTDATIQGLVRNEAPSNNYNALQNLRYDYA